MPSAKKEESEKFKYIYRQAEQSRVKKLPETETQIVGDLFISNNKNNNNKKASEKNEEQTGEKFFRLLFFVLAKLRLS